MGRTIGNRGSAVRRKFQTILKCAAIGLLLSPVSAFAQGRGDGNPGANNPGNNNPSNSNQGSARSVPEFDSAVAGAIAAIIAGGGVLIARRRRR